MRKIWMVCALVSGVGVGCGTGESNPQETGNGWRDCTESRDGWERCNNGDVIWCHAFGNPHFHSGARCTAASLECIEVDERTAVCADPSASCVEGSFECEANTALNCIDGFLSQEPCGTRRECLANSDAGVATCFDPRDTAPCSGLGTLYASGCVCSRGFRATDDEMGCVPDAP